MLNKLLSLYVKLNRQNYVLYTISINFLFISYNYELKNSRQIKFYVNFLI